MEGGIHRLLQKLTKFEKQYMWQFLLLIKGGGGGEEKTVSLSFLGGEWRLPLVHWAVAYPAAEHHAEDHLEDLGGVEEAKRHVQSLNHPIQLRSNSHLSESKAEQSNSNTQRVSV